MTRDFYPLAGVLIAAASAVLVIGAVLGLLS